MAPTETSYFHTEKTAICSGHSPHAPEDEHRWRRPQWEQSTHGAVCDSAYKGWDGGRAWEKTHKVNNHSQTKKRLNKNLTGT